MYTKYKISLLFLIVSSFFFYLPVRAASLTFVSDTISNSRPGINANHTIKFTVTNTVPSSGKIVVTPQAGAFTIPAGFNFADIDFLVDGTNRSLDVSPGSGSGSAIGVSVTTGTSGSITFTLNDSDAITTGSVVTIKIGTHASFGATGARQIQNPSGAGSYKVSLQTQNASGGIIDQAQAMVAIQTLVSVGVEVPSAATARVAINSITDNNKQQNRFSGSARVFAMLGVAGATVAGIIFWPQISAFGQDLLSWFTATGKIGGGLPGQAGLSAFGLSLIMAAIAAAIITAIFIAVRRENRTVPNSPVSDASVNPIVGIRGGVAPAAPDSIGRVGAPLAAAVPRLIG